MARGERLWGCYEAMAKRKKPGATPDRKALEAMRAQEAAAYGAQIDALREKLISGQKLSGRELASIRAWESQQLERWGPQYAANCPKSDYCDATHIQWSVAIDHSRRFGLPYHQSATVDLFACLAAWHAWASKNNRAITKVLRAQVVEEVLEDDESPTDGLDFWQKELVKERAIKERDQRLERQRDLVPREVIHSLLQEYYVAPMLRRIDSLDRRDEPLCVELASGLRDDVQAFQEGLKLLFGEDASGDDGQ